MVITSSQMNDLEKRFAHLLQPIRDLTKNWDVDIASQLEEYLDEIEHITISFDDGATVMNFAEAALVIQGSTSVYSRKVEYLYSLTYQVLGLIASKRKQKAIPEGEDGEDVITADDGEDEFLSLDDTKEHKNIDIRNDNDDLRKCVRAIPITPLPLIPFSDDEKGENPLLSKKGEILASRGDFRMNTSTPHPSGMMLLEMSRSNVLHCSFMTAATSTPIAPHLSCYDAAVPEVLTKDTHDESDEGHHSFMCVDNGVDDGCDDICNGDDIPAQEEGVGVVRRSERERQPQQHIADAPKSTVDPLALLDPHNGEGIMQKPFTKGRPWRLPACLKKTNKRKKTQEPTMPDRPQISEAISKFFDSGWSRLPKNSLKLPAYMELEEMFVVEQKRRLAVCKNHRSALALAGRNATLAERADLEGEEGMEEGICFIDPSNDDEDAGDDGQHPADIDMADIHASHALDGITPLHADLLAATIDGENVSSFEELVKQHIEGFLLNAQLYTNKTELEKRVSQWEERIGPILEEEESHGAFDIHHYSSWMLDKMKLGERSSFQAIVAGEQSFEICRLFLVTLQLANNYNVEVVSQGDTLERRMDQLELVALDKTLHHVNLAET